MNIENRACFLGSAGAGCFFSVFDSMIPENEDGWYTFILKGGPGTGKSTLMKKLADKAEKQDIGCERICCASDPGSLDAVIFPGLRACVADGTAPHQMEPTYPGADSEIVDLGFWNTEELAKKRDEIIRLTDMNRELHAKARRFLDVCFSVCRRAAAIERSCIDTEKTARYASRLAARSFSAKSETQGRVGKRLLEAVTPQGFAFAAGYALERCEKITVFEDENGAAASDILERLAKLAVGSGESVIISPSISGRGIRHLMIPELGTGFFTSDCLCPVIISEAKVIHASRFVNASQMKENREKLKFAEKTSSELLGEACRLLRTAGEVHGELEKIYIAAMDFSKTDEAAEMIFKKLWARNWREKGEN